MKRNKQFEIFAKEMLGEKYASKGDIARIYLYYGEKEKSLEMIKSIFDNWSIPLTRYDGRENDEKYIDSPFFLNNLASAQIGRAALLDIAGLRPELASQFYEWAIQNSSMPEDYVEDCVKTKFFGEAAQGYVWHGYALLVLGRLDDAYESLKQANFLFNKEKLRGEINEDVEYGLLKVLMPLCEYKLNPSDENRNAARKGVEDFIDSVTRNGSKLQSLLYYYHLKAKFPEVYEGNEPVVKEHVTMKGKDQLKLSPKDVDNRGAVVVYDPTGYLDIFGKPRELLKFVKTVSVMGNYPLLSGLLDYYNVEGSSGIDPRELADECERLIKDTKDEWLREKAESLLDVAKESEEEGSIVILYQDTDIDTG